MHGCGPTAFDWSFAWPVLVAMACIVLAGLVSLFLPEAKR
jgi:hypothetical protein